VLRLGPNQNVLRLGPNQNVVRVLDDYDSGVVSSVSVVDDGVEEDPVSKDASTHTDSVVAASNTAPRRRPPRPPPLNPMASALKFVCEQMLSDYKIVKREADGTTFKHVCPGDDQHGQVFVPDGTTNYIEVLDDAVIRPLQAIVTKTAMKRKFGDGRDYKEAVPEGMDQMNVVAAFAIHNPSEQIKYNYKKGSLPRVNPDFSMTNQPLCQPGANGNPEIDTFSPLDATKGETYLFHGTEPQYVKSILENGLSTEYSKDTGLFGAGLYFTETSSKVDQYTTKVPKSKNPIYPALMVRVAMGKTAGGTGRPYSSQTAIAPIRPNVAERGKVVLMQKVFANAMKLRNVGQVLKHYGANKKVLKSAASSTGSEVDKIKTARAAFTSLVGEGFPTGKADGTRTLKSDGNEFVVYDGGQTYVSHLWFYERYRREDNVERTQDEIFLLQKSAEKGEHAAPSTDGLTTREIRFGPNSFYWGAPTEPKNLLDIFRVKKIICDPATSCVKIVYDSPSGKGFRSRFFYDDITMTATVSTNALDFARKLKSKIDGFGKHVLYDHRCASTAHELAASVGVASGLRDTARFRGRQRSVLDAESTL